MATKSVDFTKLKSDIMREMKLKSSEAFRRVSSSDRIEMGHALIFEMKGAIKKGISPIEGRGRLPGYKWAGKAGEIRKVQRSLTGARRQRAAEKMKSIKATKYPYSVRNRFPSKRERPVNLHLSGGFLNSYESKPTTSGFEVGIYDPVYEEFEHGHRYGANGQPSRPTIPIDRETFSRSIHRRLVAIVSLTFRRRLGLDK